MEDIYKLIPHREPFLFVDKILEVTETGATTQRTIREEEPHFAGHYPGNPIMPGVLLCEATFQTGGIYLTTKLQNDGQDPTKLTPVLARIKEAKFKHIVRPGDTVELTVTMKETLGQFHFLTGKATVNGKVAMTNEFALALIEDQPQS